MIDGFNVLTTVEAALGGAVVLVCRDTTCRDIAGIHGSYRKVAETLPALDRLATVLERLGVHQCHWLFDRPVSNSGRIRGIVFETAAERGWTGPSSWWMTPTRSSPRRPKSLPPRIARSSITALPG